MGIQGKLFASARFSKVAEVSAIDNLYSQLLKNKQQLARS